MAVIKGTPPPVTDTTNAAQKPQPSGAGVGSTAATMLSMAINGMLEEGKPIIVDMGKAKDDMPESAEVNAPPMPFINWVDDTQGNA